MTSVSCRVCSAPVTESVCDLGMSPLSNAFVRRDDMQRMEPFYPLHALVCTNCWLVQLGDFESPERIFAEDYAYFSSFSESWLQHARAYVDTITPRLSLGPASQVVEIASNDGYLLRNFVERGIAVLGIEPAANVAAAAERQGVPTLVRFFGSALARELSAQGRQADLIVGNNVLAHVPDVNDFVEGLRVLLQPQGTITMEFPHLLRLLEERQFDTIYHEHFSYFSLQTVTRVFEAHHLTVVDVEELPTHGGSLRIYARHREFAGGISPAVELLRAHEDERGLRRMSTYAAFGEAVKSVKRELLRFLIDARDAGHRIAAYGAAAKGNTLLNYCGVRTDLLDYVVDRSPHKQGRYLPGTRVPVHAPERITETRPDYVLILPWNLRDEVVGQMAHIREWGGRFVVAIPALEIIA